MARWWFRSRRRPRARRRRSCAWWTSPRPRAHDGPRAHYITGLRCDRHGQREGARVVVGLAGVAGGAAARSSEIIDAAVAVVIDAVAAWTPLPRGRRCHMDAVARMDAVAAWTPWPHGRRCRIF